MLFAAGECTPGADRLGVETAAFKNQSEEEIDRLMHMIVVGGGPTGVEYAGELHDFLIVSLPRSGMAANISQDDLKKWYPEIADRLRISLIEALPNVLPAFSKQLINYTESQFKENKIDVLTRTMVKDVKERSVIVQDANKEIREIPYGLLVWATGNTSREITRKLMAKLPQAQNQRRGLVVDDYMAMVGANGIYAVGDCTATSYAPTAQVASQQGMYLASMFAKLGQKAKLERELAELRASNAAADEIESTVKKLTRAAKVSPFHYSHQVSMRNQSKLSGRPMLMIVGIPGLHWFREGYRRSSILQRKLRVRRSSCHVVLAIRLRRECLFLRRSDRTSN